MLIRHQSFKPKGRPVTHRSTLEVRKRFEQTAGSLKTLSRASAGLATWERSSDLRCSVLRVNSKVFRGILPKTFSRSRSTAGGVSGGAFLSTRVILPLPLILPSTYASMNLKSSKAKKKVK